MLQVGKPVNGHHFIGREKEINEIKAYLEIGQSVVLIAPRRFGKTSLVQEVLRRIKKDNKYVGFVDLFEYVNLHQLSEGIVSEMLENDGLKKVYQQAKGSIMSLLKNVHLKAVVDDFEFILGMQERPKEEMEWFQQAVDFIDQFSKRNKQKTSFAFDEYGDILKFDSSGEIIKLMRSKIQQHDNAVYIFSGSYESVMDTLFVDRKSPFYRLAKIIKLGYLEFEVTKKYMLRMLKQYDIYPKNKLIEDTIDFLKGHPYYCQLALQQIFLFQKLENKEPTFEELLNLMIQSEYNYLQKTWENISTSFENANVLKYLSENEQGLYTYSKKKNINASRSIKALEGQGIIYRENKNYLFYDPVFQYWIATSIKG